MKLLTKADSSRITTIFLQNYVHKGALAYWFPLLPCLLTLAAFAYPYRNLDGTADKTVLFAQAMFNKTAIGRI